VAGASTEERAQGRCTTGIMKQNSEWKEMQGENKGGMESDTRWTCNR
jgi:hypothetical protein